VASHPHPCEICERLEQIERGEHPGFIAHLQSGAFVLGDSQQFPGYALLLCKTPVPDLEDLDWNARLDFLRDLALCSEALSKVVKPHKMNVESLGNMVPHLHFHLFPRFQTEVDPLKPVWVQMKPDAPALNGARDRKLIGQLRLEIERLQRERL